MQDNQNIVLVRLKNPSLGIVTPPLGIGYLLKALKTVDHITSFFVDCHLHKIDDASLIKRIQKLDPVLIGIQVFSIDYVRFRKILPTLKQALPNTTIVAGGPHVTALPELTLESNPALDFIVRGEGEIALPMLVRKLLDRHSELSLSDIPNLVYRDNGRCIRNRAIWVDVKEFGAPEWQLLEPQHYPPIQHGTFHKSTRVVPILTSRGCPYPCTFCAGSLVTGRTIRRRDVEDVVDEIEFLQKRYGFEEIIIEDENFTFTKEHVIAFANEINRRAIQCFFSFPNGLRLDRIDEDIVQKLQSIGTYMVALGIESIANNTMKRMKKRWSREQIKNTVNLLKKYKFIVQANFILGFRDDTVKDIQESIDFALELNVDQVYFGNYIPLPGTADFNLLIEKGELRLNDIDWSQYNAYYGQLPYHPKDISERELDRAIKKATIRFYLRPRILVGFLKRLYHPVFIKSLIFRTRRVFLNYRFKST
jgi:radical SAM superfamily enzyme YgiQ (UPF0313 family)